MPSKQTARDRSRTQSREHHQLQQRARAWGTRFDSLSFDTLNSSPPHTQSSSPPSSPPAYPAPGASSAQLAHALSLELFGASATPTEKRDWADDDVPSTLFSPGRAPPSLVLDVTGGSITGRKDIAKLPHDASVFVGSLPPDIDETEMAQLLAQHLAQFASVQNIKIIRDSKGGLCAFAQCENATQATQLVSQAQANPQPFMGRHLRYENARARRALWISYRTPMHFMPCESQDEEGVDVVVNDNGVKGRWIESDLPDLDLRIWKPRDARFPIVTYQGEARNIGDASRFDEDASVAPAFRHKGVLFTDLKFDAQSIKRMAEAFGPLESFKPYSTSNAYGEESNVCPADHGASRLPGMDLGVWEVKWGHRDDCIAALNTLRRIPHLTVTWAKDFAYPQTPRSGFLRTPTSPRYPASYSPREAISPIARGRPFLLLDCASRNDNSFLGADSPSSASYSSSMISPQKRSVRPVPPRRANDPACRGPDGEEADDGWTFVRTQNITRAIMSSFPGSTSESPMITEDDKEKVPEWNEGDFPPLQATRGISRNMEKMVEGEQKLSPSPAFISLNDPAPSSPTIGQKAALIPENGTSGEMSPVGDTRGRPRPLVIHRRSLSNPVARCQAEDPHASPNTQMLEIPPTPELGITSLTPTPTSAQPDPETPIYPSMVPLAAPDFTGQQQKPPVQDQGSEGAPSESGRSVSTSASTGRREHQRQTTVDPKTIFVGGLEPFGPRPWNEARLREIFEKYGEVQDVRIVNPMSKKTGFAFVTFIDEQSTLKAIREEHNRSYDGRQIRVQIRDMFPPRGGFKFRGRGLGRRPFGFDPHFVGVGHHPNICRPGEQNSLGLSRTHQPFGHHISGDRGNAPFRVIQHVPQQLVASVSAITDSSTLRSLNSFELRSEVDASQESDSKTNISVTSPSALSASTSASGVIAPVAPQGMPPAQFGYYPQHSWAPPYGAQMHYSMPYGAYGGMMPPVPMHFAPASQGVDPNAAAGNTPMHWGPMYRATVPFAPYPYMIVPPTGTEAPRSATSTSQPHTPVKGQPPLHATGFIQGEHGTLIPVYQPEALDEYMSGTSPTQSMAQPREASTGSGPSATGHQQGFVTAQMWAGYPHAPQFIAYPVPQTSTTSIPSSGTSPVPVQQQVMHQQNHGQLLQPSNSGSGSYISPGVVTAVHPHSSQQQVTSFTGSGVGMSGMPPPYFAGTHPTAAGVPPIMAPRGGPAGRSALSERPNTYMNKHPPRRDPGFHHSRNGYGHGHGSNFGGARSQSTVRSASGPANAPREDYHQNSNAFTQRQRHPNAQAPPPPQLGFNKHIPDGGHPQQ